MEGEGPSATNVSLFAEIKSSVQAGNLAMLKGLAKQHGFANIQFVDNVNRLLHFACEDFKRNLTKPQVFLKLAMVEWIVENGGAETGVQMQAGGQTPLHKAVAGYTQFIFHFVWLCVDL